MPDTNPTIKIYANYSPNTNGEHIIYNDFTDYTAFLNTHLLDTISVDNYRINQQGRIEVNLSESITLANYKNATYIVHSLDNMCYTVRSATYQSGYVIYDVEVDYWGTYIGEANLKNILLLSCDKNINVDSLYGKGVYPACDITTNEGTYRFDVPVAMSQDVNYTTFVKLEKTYIVFSLQYVVKTVNFGNGAITATGLYALDLKSIMDSFLIGGSAAVQTMKKAQNAIDVAIGVVGGIYAVKSSAAFISAAIETDAQVTQVFLATEDMLGTAPAYTDDSPYVNSKSLYGDYMAIRCKTVKYGSTKIDFNIDSLLPTSVLPEYFMNNNAIYFGTINNGIRVNSIKGDYTVHIKVYRSADKITVIAAQGDNQRDITEAFKLPFITNSGDVTQLGGIKGILSTLTNLVTAGVSLFTGNIPAAVSGANEIVKHATNMLGVNQRAGSMVSAGDANVSFRGSKPVGASGDTYEYSIIYPFGVIYYPAIKQNNLLGKFGIVYNCVINTNDFLNMFSNLTAQFVSAKLTCDNIPKIAAEVIQSKFASGIYLRKAPTPTPTRDTEEK